METIKPYYQAIENWLELLSERKVNSLVMLALIDDPNEFDVFASYNAGPLELATCSGILNMHAAFAFNEAQYDDGEEDAP